MTARRCLFWAVSIAGACLISACDTAPTPTPAPTPASSAQALTAANAPDWYQACWAFFNGRDFAKFKACYSDAAVSRQIGYSPNPFTRGPDAIVASSEAFVKQNPDVSGHPQLILINSYRLASISTVRGTNTAPLPGSEGKEVPATNKKFGLLFGHSIEIDLQGAKVVTEVGVMDTGTIAGQLGLRPWPVRPAVESSLTAPMVVIASNDDREKANLEALALQTEAFNRHDLKGWASYNAPNLVFHEIAAPADASGEATGNSLREMWNAFSDLRLVLDPAWAAGDYVVYTGRLEGTNTGPFPAMGIRSKTGRKVSLPFLEIDRMENGKFVENWIFYDSASMARQLGLMQ